MKSTTAQKNNPDRGSWRHPLSRTRTLRTSRITLLWNQKHLAKAVPVKTSRAVKLLDLLAAGRVVPSRPDLLCRHLQVHLPPASHRHVQDQLHCCLQVRALHLHEAPVPPLLRPITRLLLLPPPSDPTVEVVFSTPAAYWATVKLRNPVDGAN
jgi:hypothetical protein